MFLLIIIIIIIIPRFFIALFKVPKVALQRNTNIKGYKWTIHTVHTCIQTQTDTQKQQYKGGKRDRERVEKDLSGVVSDVEEMGFEMTFERRQ